MKLVKTSGADLAQNPPQQKGKETKFSTGGGGERLTTAATSVFPSTQKRPILGRWIRPHKNCPYSVPIEKVLNSIGYKHILPQSE